MKVLLLGDVHGAHAGLAALLTAARDRHGIGAAIQTGDFGFTRAHFARGFAGGRLPVPLYAIDGNHDDHAWLHRAARKGETARWRDEWNLHFQPRASTVRIGGVAVGFLGGALHVDRAQYRHWWFRDIANFILAHERARATRLFNDERPALLVTHSCPAGIGVGIRGNPALAMQLALHVHGAGFDPGPEHDCGEVELVRLWHHLRIPPALWAFGHFHQRHDRRIGDTRFVCTDTLDAAELLVWDTGTGGVEAIPNPGLSPPGFPR